jgi:5-methylcytosine-specific restriction protein B
MKFCFSTLGCAERSLDEVIALAKKYNKTFFTQFHAETTYSDFVYGIQPKLDANTLTYEAKKGILYEAIE